jgi:hypothetical protein
MKTLLTTKRAPLLAAVLFGAAVSSAACGIDLIAQEEARNQWTKSYEIGEGATVEILNTNGKITVTAGEGESVEVVAERVVKASTEEKAKALLEEFEIRETASADLVRLDSTSRTTEFGVNRMVNYTVKLPRWANVRLETTNGDIRVDNLAGELRIEATNGRIEATGLENGARVNTTNGAISLDFAKVGDASIECETVNGTITVAVPDDANADVEARVVNGGISTDESGLSVIDESRRRVEGRLGEGGTRIRLETVNGAIRLRGRR